jgi:hypothetical protein
MTLFEILAKFRRALREEKTSDQQQHEAEQRREARDQAALDLIRAEIDRRTASDNTSYRQQQTQLRIARLALIVSVITMARSLSIP